jgi:hypothetical protein
MPVSYSAWFGSFLVGLWVLHMCLRRCIDASELFGMVRKLLGSVGVLHMRLRRCIDASELLGMV